VAALDRRRSLPANLVPAPVSFAEQWFSDESCDVLAGLADSVRDMEGRIVEVGSWQGRSTCALANAVNPQTVHAVDTWNGSPGELSQLLATGRDVYAEFAANVAALTAGNVEAHRMGWRDYFASDRTPIKFLFIDAEHTYVEVRDNIAAAVPLLTPGAVICGDDAHHPPIQRAVLEAFPNAERVASLWVAVIPGGIDG
jgi:predicted O-methyltransferase YrrM